MSGKIDKIINENEKHDSDIMGVAYNRGFIFTGGLDGKVKVWDTDLNLRNTIDFGSPIFAITTSPEGKLYACCNDQKVKICENPTTSKDVTAIYKDDDEFFVQVMTYVDDHLYTGDNKGLVIKFNNDKLALKFHMVEEVKTLVIEKDNIYCARDLDVVVSEIVKNENDMCAIRTNMPGKSPICLLGPKRDGYSEYIAFPDRSGMGLNLVKNHPGDKFAQLWALTDYHDMIINTICGTETCIYTAGYDGKIKGLTDLSNAQPKPCGTVDIGNCINWMCLGEKQTILYVGTTDGFLRKVSF